MSVADYTSGIKDICDSLASNVTVEEEEMVQICLGSDHSEQWSVREREYTVYFRVAIDASR